MSIPGISTTTTTELASPHRLGAYLAALGSDQQAEVLAGLAHGLDWRQPGHIADDVRRGRDGLIVSRLLYGLAVLIDPTLEEKR